MIPARQELPVGCCQHGKKSSLHSGRGRNHVFCSVVTDGETAGCYRETDTGFRINEDLERAVGLVRPPQWTAEEVKIFGDMLARHGKDFNLIAQQLRPSRTVEDVVVFYYHVWKLRRVPEARRWAEGKQDVRLSQLVAAKCLAGNMFVTTIRITHACSACCC